MNDINSIRSQKLRNLLKGVINPTPIRKQLRPGDSLTILFHHDELGEFLRMGVPESHYKKIPPPEQYHDDWIQIVIDADWVEKFLIMARLWSWDNITRHYEFVYPVAD